ncbi:MAG: hypothetical protein ACRD6X_11250, partial [Pyrinomonadaceae bacterium]
KTFDALFKVVEYQRGAAELLRTSRFIDGQIVAVTVKIARAEGEIERIDSVEQEHKTFANRTSELGDDLEKIETEIAEKAATVKLQDEQENKVASVLAEVEKLRTEHTRSEIIISQREIELKRSREAAEKVSSVRADAEKHSESLARIKELERERGEREKLNAELSKVEAAIQNVNADRKQLQSDLEKIQTSHREIESLTKLVREQERLETDVEKNRREVAKAEAAETSAKTLENDLARLRKNYLANQTQIKETTAKSKAAGELEALQSRESALVNELANVQARLESDENFQREIKNGLCPILSEKCLNMKEGQTLEAFVNSQFDELRTKIETLKTEHAATAAALRTSREAAKSLAQVAVLEARTTEIEAEGVRLKGEQEVLKKDSEMLSELRTKLKTTETELKALNNPKTRIAIFEKEVKREPEIRRQISTSEKNLERLESERRITVEKLESYKDLDMHWTEATAIREATFEANRIFLANEALAKQLLENETAFKQAGEELTIVGEKLKAAESAYEIAGKGYDRELHLSERARLIELQTRQAEVRARFEAAKQREAELAKELERLNEIRRTMQAELREKERLEKVAEVTDFIRVTLKEAAPLVARNYVYHVSVEANQMYREITGNGETTLKWAEDYGVILEEGGYERPFQSMSGGEQMAAALSVRLALLKQLSDIRIAFFDEPTTNMDAERRENLAQQIGQIRHFDQLFVISHDDTFEGYMDHEITVEREA